MARARNLKPSFFTNDVLAEIDPLGRLLFQGLWCLADREGRLEDRPKKIKAELLPYDDCDADRMLQQLHDREFILRYEACGKRFIQVLAFSKHQNPHVKEAASQIPAPYEHCASTVQEQEFPEAAGLIPDSLNPITDSRFPSEEQSVDQSTAREEIRNGSSPTDRAVEIAVYLRQRGVTGANSFNPNVAAWSDDVRITDEILDAALSKARASLGSKPVGPNYLATIVPDLLAQQNAPPSRSRPQARSYHDDRRETIEGLTGRNRKNEHDERIIDIEPVARLAG